jgi:hypothetical protein
VRWGSLAAAGLTALVAIALLAPALLPPAGAPPASLPFTSPTTAPAREVAVASAFDGEAARRHLLYLADPARRGRLTGSRGYLEAATYVADRFREIGLEPAGDGGTYLQRFPSPVVELTAMPEFAIVGFPGTAFRLRADFSELVGGSRGGGSVEAPLVYIGGAVEDGAYSDFRGVDLAGKVALISGPSDSDPGGNAIRRGAVAVLFVARSDPGPLVHFSYIPEFEKNAVPTLLVTEPVGDRLVAASGRRIAELRRTLEEQRSSPDRRSQSFDTGLLVRVSVPLGEVSDEEGLNVLGLLRPDQPADQRYVVVGGHLDGVGTDPDGTVYPGANDNASGVAVTIELARALAAERGRLRHAILFVAWAAEEQGLRGSEEFLERAVGTSLRSANIVGYINLDVSGCCGASLSASAENSSFHAVLSRAARKQGQSLGVTRGSSDHANFVRSGVPAAILIWSEIGPIHTPQDTVELVEAAHLRTIGLVAAQALLELAAGD